MRCMCARCFVWFDTQASRINRAEKTGAPLYCGRACAGEARRGFPKTDEQKRAEKSAYDAKRRVELADRIKAEKAAYHRRTYDPVKAAEERKKRMPAHIEYCRRPEYVAWKSKYDAEHRAKKHYGDWWECFLLAQSIRTEALSRATDHEMREQNGTINKAQKRRRTYERTVGNYSENCLVGNAQRSEGRPDAAGAR